MKRLNGHRLDREKLTSTQRDFIKMTGLSPELANFLTNFMGNPEIFFLMPDKKRHHIELQMDAILSKIISIK
jgi:hypothetical protein